MEDTIKISLRSIYVSSIMGNTKVATTMNFSRVYTTHKEKMYSYVFYRVGSDKDLAEDVVSDVFLKAYKAYDSYDDRFAMSTWLYSIARNTLIDHYRKGREMVDIDGIEVTDQTDPLFKLIDADISVTELYEAIDSLPDAQRLYIRKQFIEGYSANEIAADEGVSHAAVRKSVSRGVAVLREKLLSIAILINFINI